jgi:2-amino-4-hydroxy-6-hydroxymethyldihydropteridine diphosphokinase
MRNSVADSRHRLTPCRGAKYLPARMSEGRQHVAWAVVGLGANLGAPEAAFRLAAKALGKVFKVSRGSRLYSGPAMRLRGSAPQPDYVNGAVLLEEPTLSASQIVDALLRIEQQLGRTRGEQWGPRVIDLDLLLMSDHVSDDSHARVPHPGLHERAFALRPLLELVPGAVDPRTGQPYRAVLDGLGPDGLTVIGGTEWASAT